MTDPSALPPHVLSFVSGLNADDVATLKRVIRVFNNMQAWCRVSRWLFLTLIGALILISQGLDAMKNLLGMKTGH